MQAKARRYLWDTLQTTLWDTLQTYFMGHPSDQFYGTPSRPILWDTLQPNFWDTLQTNYTKSRNPTSALYNKVQSDVNHWFLWVPVYIYEFLSIYEFSKGSAFHRQQYTVNKQYQSINNEFNHFYIQIIILVLDSIDRSASNLTAECKIILS